MGVILPYNMGMATCFDFKFGKAKAALLYLAQRELPEFTKGKACKLIFLTDKLHLVQYGRPVTGDSYAAMDHGPVPSRLLDILDEVEAGAARSIEECDLSRAIALDRRFVYPRIKALQAPKTDEFSESDIEALNSVISEYGRRSFNELRRLTHDMPAYEKAWASRTSGSAPMRFEDFFDQDEDALVGVFEEMVENAKLKAVFPEPEWL